MIRRVGAIGDIHAEDELLAQALTALAAEQVDLIVATGDICDGKGDVERCCALLQEHGVQCVRGNHERWRLRGTATGLPDATDLTTLSTGAQRFLQSLLPERVFDTAAGVLLLCHGVGPDDMAQLKPDHHERDLVHLEPFQELRRSRRYDVVISGHTHEPMDRTFDHRLRWINAGTLSRGQHPVFVVADLGTGEVRFVPLASRTQGNFPLESIGAVRERGAPVLRTTVA